MVPENHDTPRTHSSISEALVGKVEWIETDKSARVTLTVDQRMQVDEKGLIHGGFTFGLADYAAMVTVNHPFVVLLSSNVRFLKPVVAGDRLTAHARISAAEGRQAVAQFGAMGRRELMEVAAAALEAVTAHNTDAFARFHIPGNFHVCMRYLGVLQ